MHLRLIECLETLRNTCDKGSLVRVYCLLIFRYLSFISPPPPQCDQKYDRCRSERKIIKFLKTFLFLVKASMQQKHYLIFTHNLSLKSSAVTLMVILGVI